MAVEASGSDSGSDIDLFDALDDLEHEAEEEAWGKGVEYGKKLGLEEGAELG